MVRRDKLEDLDMELERQTFNLAPDRWLLLYKDRMLGSAGDPDEVDLEIDDLADLDRYMEEREREFQDALTGTHSMSGASAQEPIDWLSANQAEHLQWGPWS